MSCPAVIKVVTPGPPGPSLQITGPALAGRESGTGSLVAIPIGPGLAIVNGVLTATGGGGGGGTVTSVGLSLPGIFEVTGSPVTGAGTLTAALATQAAGLVFAGPVGGDAAAPAFRQLGYGELTGRPTLGTAAGTDASAYATAAQGAKADTAVQGVTGTGPIVSSGGTTPAISISAATASAAGSMSSADKTKLDGIQAGAEVNVNADWNASSGDAQILNKPTLGTAAAASTGDFAPAAEGVTNGNSHNHDGDDGAQIAYNSLLGLPGVVSPSSAGLAPATSFASLTYGATVALDLAALDGQVRTITLTGNLELTNSSLAAGRTLVIRLIPGASQRTLTFPVGWKFYSDKPSTIAANKEAVLSLTYFGTADTDCVAVYKQQP